jgi:molybdopterin synthase catalytic subunit
MQRELAGTRELSLELPGGATIEDAWSALVERFPGLAPGRVSVRFARNGAYAGPETPLADGDEVAMIPPVSGGSDDAASKAGASAEAASKAGTSAEGGSAVAAHAEPAFAEGLSTRRIIELRSVPLGPAILEELAARIATPEDGAVVGFLGVTRRSPGTPAPGQEAEAARHAGRSVESLEYEAHPTMALAVIGDIADEIEARFGVTGIAIVHREGVVPLGEASVAIVACAPHRDAAFDAARYAIDETKARAPIWKAERFTDGKVWIGEPARESPRAEV